MQGLKNEQGENRLIDLSKGRWKMLEFFAGTGLVALGLKGMFSPVWSSDISVMKKAIYASNFNSGHFVLSDIKTVKGAELPQAHLSWGSFPCQDLSLAGNLGGITAERSGLFWEWLRVLGEMSEKPRVLCLENVTGLLSANGGKNYLLLHRALNDMGYRCGAVVLNASHFVPQSRPRVFVIAVSQDVKIPTYLVSSEPCWLHNTPARRIGESLSDWIWWNTEEPPARKTQLEQILEPDAEWDKDDVVRLVPQKHLDMLCTGEQHYAPGFRRTRNDGQRLELRFDGLAGCLRTGAGGSSKQFLVKKSEDGFHARLVTVREAARLMGAPDSFRLPQGNEGYTALGDAVAVPVSEFLGSRFLSPLTDSAYEESTHREISAA